MYWGLAVVVVIFAACGKGSSAAEVEACSRMATLCAGELSAEELRECRTDWPEFRKQFGDATADKFLTCTKQAENCAEILGCVAGVVGRMGKDFAKGVDTMLADDEVPSRRGPFADPFFDGTPLPRACARADEVCDKDEPFARDKCRRMVGNLKSDAENLNELTMCYARAKNCYAFKKCTNNMWFKLN